MLLTIGSVVLGVAIGLSLTPRTTRFARPRVHAVGALAAGVIGQLVASRLTGSPAVLLAVASLGALVAFAVANLHLAGMGVLTIGLCMNLLMILENGGMPVRPRSLVVAGVVESDQLDAIQLRGPRHLERASDELTAFGDIIPMPGHVVSYGDLIIAVATVDVIVHLSRRQRRRQVAINNASPVHDWGIAPSPVPSSASQYSASPDDSAPRTLVSATSAPASHNR